MCNKYIRCDLGIILNAGGKYKGRDGKKKMSSELQRAVDIMIRDEEAKKKKNVFLLEM